MTGCNVLVGNLTEVMDRVTAAPGTFRLTSADYWLNRRRTIGVRVSVGLNERVNHVMVPMSAWYTSHLETMRVIAEDHIAYVNDVHSVEKETARDEVNLVHLLMAENGWTREQVITHIVERANAELCRFTTLETQLPTLCERLGLKTHERDQVDRYVQILRDWIRGNYDWSRAAGRYTREAIKPAHQPGHLYIEELWDGRLRGN